MLIKLHSGIGDAVYSFPVVKKLYEREKNISLITPHPIVFHTLEGINFTDTRREPDLFLRYTNQKRSERTQYEDICFSAGMEPPPFVLDWKLGFSDSFRAETLPEFLDCYNTSRKKLCIIKEPCTAHMDKMSKSFRVTPSAVAMQTFIAEKKHEYFFVSVGYKEVFKKRLQGIDYDLNDKTEVQDIFTLVQMSSLVVSQVGHLVPIAQAFKKPLKVFYPEAAGGALNTRPEKIEFKEF